MRVYKAEICYNESMNTMPNRKSLMPAAISLTIAAFFSVCFSSCAKKDGTEKIDNKNTLRYQLEQMLDEFQWSEELEPGRLSANVSRYGNVSDKVHTSIISVICSVPSNAEGKVEEEPLVYPYVEGFGNLDTGATPKTIVDSAEKFCDAIQDGTDADSLVARNSIYSLALFYRDIDELKNERKISAFTSHLLGSSFTSGTSYEQPVRFYDAEFKNFVDVNLFFSEDVGSWKIDQIQIEKTNFESAASKKTENKN